MRGTWLVIVIACTGCFVRPRPFRFPDLHIVAPPVTVLPVPVGVQLVGGVAPPPAQQGGGEAPPPPPPRAQTYYARFQGAGGKWLCEPNPDADSCSRSCNARFELALKMGAGTSCECTTERRCDQMVDH